jgi:transposase InsO family protein
MDCCANTFRKARTSLVTTAEKFRPLPMRSTTGPAKHSGGEHRRKCLLTNYTHVHDTVLQRPVESAQYTSIAFTDRPLEVRIDASIGTVDAHDNSLAESVDGLYKTELIKQRGPWRNAAHVEAETADYLHWFNHDRLYEYCGDMPPIECEHVYYN